MWRDIINLLEEGCDLTKQGVDFALVPYIEFSFFSFAVRVIGTDESGWLTPVCS